MAEPTTQKNVRLPWTLAQQLEDASRATGMPQQEIIIEALEQWFTAQVQQALEKKEEK